MKPRRRRDSKDLTSEEVKRILDAVHSGDSYRDIAGRTGVSESTAYNVLKDYPLWNFLKHSHS